MYGVRKIMENKEISPFFALVFRQKYIKRWGLMYNMIPETLAEHSSECAVLTHALATIGNKLYGKKYDVGSAVITALFHDVPEVFTGDMPTPVKYATPAVREEFGRIEEQSARNLLSKLPTPLKEEYAPLFEAVNSEPGQGAEEIHRLVKAADNLCAYIKCIEEEKLSNREFSSAKAGIKRKLEVSGLPELDYFIEHFLPAFGMTLDEQQDMQLK